ncbi:MAG: succinate dehydrogenase cytochrome b subunit [Bacteroidaceae bacterium]|jgi:succinate dehydrogenase / fumarate reductase cytochrome b subunit
MWLINSSVGRKLVMSISGLFLVLFVTFHMAMNLVAVISEDGYDAVCEFLGANWYALAGTAVLALGFVVHIVYAFILTAQNRRARGSQDYAVSERPKGVEWASQNMLVLGLIVILFFLLHLTHFWGKMQLPEIMGEYPEGGIDLIQQVFSSPLNLVLYLIWFVAIWFHLTHGFWSALQTLGWSNRVWFNRWRTIGNVWATVVLAGFALSAIVFYVKYGLMC